VVRAIDLIDEAASRIRMEIDSMPEEMDRLDRRIIQLKIEREALKKESDEASRRRLSDLEMETARRAGDLARMSELQYGRMPELERRLAEAERAEQKETTLVILLDEVEKAHPDVFNVLLQVLDDGRLTDGQGRNVDFRNTVIVMTSNLGSDMIQRLAGEDRYAEMKEAVMEIVGQHFRPEFIDRVDDVVVFHPLERGQIRRIARLQVDILAKRLENRGMQLEVTDEALDLLGNIGFDPVYGARPLKRVIQQRLGNPLAQDVLAGTFGPGDTIHAESEIGELVFGATRD
jgi:ATP-dependent Clp protease ATP-binding subunit ClpA